MSIDFAGDAEGRELRLLVLRLQYERHVDDQVRRLLEDAFNRIADVMLSRKYRDLTIAQRARLNQMLAEIGRNLGEDYKGVTQMVLDEMRHYAQTESDIARATVNGVLSTGAGDVAVSFYRLPKAYLQAIAKLPIQGLRLGEWFDGQATTMGLRTKQIVQQGLIEGKGNAEIARRIMAPDRAMGPNLPPALIRRARNEARIIARTTVNAVQNDATMQSYSQLPRSVSDSYMWVSVLDKRTSAVCRGLDGRVWKYDDPGGQKPPAHLQCRSTTRALLRGEGLTLAEQKEKPTMSKYSAWLTAQPASVQNEILGPTRAGLFRDGRMSLADAIDADNRVLTLKQLREKLGLDALVVK